MTQNRKYRWEDLQFGLNAPPRSPKYKGFSRQSMYLDMKDGVKLAVDVLLPQGLQEGEKIPSLVYRTRYWRDIEFREPKEIRNPAVEYYISYGYAVVKLDVRGTGASFGRVIHEWQAEDTLDAYEVVDWIISQSWSNGKVGAFGFSYPGTTALLMLETGHPAVKAVRPSYFEFDAILDIAMPGGIKTKFLTAWGKYCQSLDNNILLGDDGKPDKAVVGVKPVVEDRDMSMLKAAIREHRMNQHAHTLLAGACVDQPGELTGRAIQEMLVYPRKEKIEKSGGAVDIWGSWMDANTADTVLRFISNFNNPQRAVIGAWNHGGTSYDSPFVHPNSPLDMPLEEQLHEAVSFFDRYLGDSPSRSNEKILYYLTMGEEKWKSTKVWPLPETRVQRWYLQPGNRLSPGLPGRNGGENTYTVNFTHTTGMRNRWWTEMDGSPVVYDDRARQDEKLLVYESPPLEDDMEITGYPIVKLHVSSTHTDGAFFVYLECVGDSDKVTYITEGMLRALHRKVSHDTPPYRNFVPYHSYFSKDRLILVPGEIAELHFGLFPVSALIRRGARIRIAIAGADADSFERIPDGLDPVITVQHNIEYPSYIDLPVIPRK